MLELKDDSWMVTISELWGPLPCECKEAGCEKESWSIILTKEEYQKLKEKSGSKMVKYVLDNKLGEVICDSCLGKKIIEIGVLDPKS